MMIGVENPWATEKSTHLNEVRWLIYPEGELRVPLEEYGFGPRLRKAQFC